MIDRPVGRAAGVKVLLVLDSVSFGGAENLLVPLSRAAASAGFIFDVVTVAPEIPAARHLAPALEAAGIHVEHLNIPRLLHPPAVPRLVSAIRASGCDLVHAHLESACTLTPVAAALTGRPSLCTFHHVPDSLEGRAAWRERASIAAASRSRGVLFVSEASRSAFAAKYPPRANWRVVHNGIDLGAFSPDGARGLQGLELPADAPIVALVAAMRQQL